LTSKVGIWRIQEGVTDLNPAILIILYICCQVNHLG
jgi:hypothetical protein